MSKFSLMFSDARLGKYGDAPVPVPQQAEKPVVLSRAVVTVPATFNMSVLAGMAKRNWRLALGFMFVFLGAVTVTAFLLKNRYESVAHLEIDPRQSSGVIMPGTSMEQSSQDYLQTQIEILRSDELAADVIEQLHLDQNAAFIDKAVWEREVTAREAALRALRSGLSIEQVRNSRLVEVSFTSPDPVLAANVANMVVHRFIERNAKTLYDSAMQASTWLSQELGDLRDKVQASNQALVDYSKANGITVDAEGKEDPITQKAVDLSKELTLAQADRLRAEAAVQTAATGDPAALTPTKDNSVVDTLVQHYAEAQVQLADAMATMGENHPKVKKLQSQVSELSAQIEQERKRTVARLNSAYEASRTHEQLLAKSLDQTNSTLQAVNQKMIRYRVLKAEAKANEELYNALVTRGKESVISAGLESTTIRIVDNARVPDRPSKPHRGQIIIFGGLLAFIGAIVLCFVKESMDDTIRTPQDVQGNVPLAAVGFVPELSGKLRKQHLLEAGSAIPFALVNPGSPASEAMRNLLASIRLSRTGRSAKTILVASPGSKEGKTTLAVNLALTLARSESVCLVDADLRKHTNLFGLEPAMGLAEVLRGAPLGSAVTKVPGASNLSLLTSGSLLESPAELVGSPAMGSAIADLAQRFDAVIIDSPPLIPYADAKLLASQVDAVILVGRYGETTRDALALSAEALQASNANVLGVVLNGVDPTASYYQYYREAYAGPAAPGKAASS